MIAASIPPIKDSIKHLFIIITSCKAVNRSLFSGVIISDKISQNCHMVFCEVGNSTESEGVNKPPSESVCALSFPSIKPSSVSEGGCLLNM